MLAVKELLFIDLFLLAPFKVNRQFRVPILKLLLEFESQPIKRLHRQLRHLHTQLFLLKSDLFHAGDLGLLLVTQVVLSLDRGRDYF